MQEFFFRTFLPYDLKWLRLCSVSLEFRFLKPIYSRFDLSANQLDNFVTKDFSNIFTKNMC